MAPEAPPDEGVAPEAKETQKLIITKAKRTKAGAVDMVVLVVVVVLEIRSKSQCLVNVVVIDNHKTS